MNAGDIALDATRRGSRPLVPEFPESLHWVNRADRVRLGDWRGQIVLVLFWNGTSTSSLNLLGELRQLAKRHPDAFVPVCVHTPRYASQRSAATV
jgi:hypothetical protein